MMTAKIYNDPHVYMNHSTDTIIVYLFGTEEEIVSYDLNIVILMRIGLNNSWDYHNLVF